MVRASEKATATGGSVRIRYRGSLRRCVGPDGRQVVPPDHGEHDERADRDSDVVEPSVETQKHGELRQTRTGESEGGDPNVLTPDDTGNGAGQGNEIQQDARAPRLDKLRERPGEPNEVAVDREQFRRVRVEQAKGEDERQFRPDLHHCPGDEASNDDGSKTASGTVVHTWWQDSRRMNASTSEGMDIV